ncbi:MAG: biotin--[acetyl-CoA-carboxylase] ligase [Desulfobulbaceae bacterium]|nr:biotin--[acetyl-CoA-carboxylase] ligase [Desulfobulbaceae bacterium]
MAVISELSPRFVRELVHDEEIPARNRHISPKTVHEIFRYGATVATTIHKFEKLGRCMDHARKLIREYEEKGVSFPCGMVIMADELTGSTGRFGRYWHAPRGGVWMTLALVNTLLPQNRGIIPLAAGVACCETIREYGIHAHVKWVNDVFADGKKIAGILTETMTGPRFGEEYILVGIGINVNNDLFPAALAPLSISMKGIMKKELDINMVAARLFAKLSWNMGILHYEDRLALEYITPYDQENRKEHLLLKQWRFLNNTIGRRARFAYNLEKGPSYEANVEGLDAGGGLILRRVDNGRTVVEKSGEIVYLE